MGVSIELSGRLAEPARRRALLEWVGMRAAELEWALREVSITFKQARVGGHGTSTPVEMLEARGVSLLPQFACEAIPLVFQEPTGLLLDEYVRDEGSGIPTLWPDVIVKTQFAGPAVHAEVCSFLRELKNDFAPDIAIDDESGFFETGDRGELDRAFERGFAAIRAKIESDGLEPGRKFQVGDFPFEVTASHPDELDLLDEQEREVLLGLDAAFVAQYSGFGTTLDHSAASVTDLELVVSDADAPDYAKDLNDPQLESFAHASGAYFGRTLVAALGGAWRTDEEEGLHLVDVGRCGLVVNPFRAAAERLALGPPFGLDHHFNVYSALARAFGREAP